MGAHAHAEILDFRILFESLVQHAKSEFSRCRANVDQIWPVSDQPWAKSGRSWPTSGQVWSISGHFWSKLAGWSRSGKLWSDPGQGVFLVAAGQKVAAGHGGGAKDWSSRAKLCGRRKIIASGQDVWRRLGNSAVRFSSDWMHEKCRWPVGLSGACVGTKLANSVGVRLGGSRQSGPRTALERCSMGCCL